MGIQEKIEKNKAWLVPLVLVGGAVALFLSVRNFTSGGISQQAINRAYYSDDEGKSYFEDDLGKATPFDHGGKQAYRAYVFRCGNGKPIVGFLGRQAGSPTKPAASGSAMQSTAAGIEIKKPGTDAWFKFDSPEGSKIFSTVCPDGRPMAVIPGESEE